MKRVWFLVPLSPSSGEGLPALMATLSDLGLVHVEALKGGPDEGPPARRPEVLETADIEARLAKLRQILDVFDAHAPVKRGFAANFVSLPLEVTRRDYERALAETDVEALHRRAMDLARQHEGLSRRRAEVAGELERLAPWAGAPVGAAPTLRRCAAWLGTVPARKWQRVEADPEAREGLVIKKVAARAGKVLVAAVALAEEAATAGDRLRRAGFDPLDLPAGTAALDHRIADLERQKEEADRRLAGLDRDVADLAATRRAAVTVCLAHWEVALATLSSLRGTVETRRIGVATGYVRAADLARLRRALAERQPGVTLLDRDPSPDELVPISLRTRPLFAPARFLTRLFGVPDYFGFDPSPYIFLTFLLFFGFCFGDAIYGLLILAAAGAISRRLRGYPDLRDFFRLIAWGGVSSVLVGVVTGTWAADLFSPSAGFVSEGSFPARLREALMVKAFDPLDQPVRVLLVALAIGVANQLYGMVLRMYREARRGDWVAAVCDGGLWLLFLPGLIMLLAAGLATVPAWVSRVGVILLGTGAAGLVLTQGRREKGLFAKALTGIVSLYGILGTYGTTSFIGDTLSYSRLLALGLTTTIVGMCFNIIAGLVKGVPVAGVLIVMLVLLIGHVFNILVSILGAFVHSGRLIFVEFFGRFYEVGGKRFRALGTSDRVRVVGA